MAINPSRKSPYNSSSSQVKKMKTLAANKKLLKRKSSPKKSKRVVKAKGADVKREYSCVDENSLAMKRAQEIQETLPPEFPNLVKFMLHSHVTGGFWLGLPKGFCVANLPNHDAAVVLVDEDEKEWETKYLVEKNGLSAGWRRFSIKHNLIAGDVLIFQLIEPCKFKVVIVRESDSPEVDFAISLLRLSHSPQPIATVIPEGPLPLQQHAESSDHSPSSDLSGSDEEEDDASQEMDGLRFADSVPDFSEVKDFEAFNILVNGIIIDSEIPKDLRAKYYELCCSQKGYLHQNLIDGLNYKLIAGVIAETVNIADAIRASNLITGRDHLEVWDRTLKGFECFGMEVGFLRARLSKLISLASDSVEIVTSKGKERAHAKTELKDLEAKISTVKETIQNLDAEIALYSSKDRLEMMFKDVATAPW